MIAPVVAAAVVVLLLNRPTRAIMRHVTLRPKNSTMRCTIQTHYELSPQTTSQTWNNFFFLSSDCFSFFQRALHERWRKRCKFEIVTQPVTMSFFFAVGRDLSSLLLTSTFWLRRIYDVNQRSTHDIRINVRWSGVIIGRWLIRRFCLTRNIKSGHRLYILLEWYDTKYEDDTKQLRMGRRQGLSKTTHLPPDPMPI